MCRVNRVRIGHRYLLIGQVSYEILQDLVFVQVIYHIWVSKLGFG